MPCLSCIFSRKEVWDIAISITKKPQTIEIEGPAMESTILQNKLKVCKWEFCQRRQDKTIQLFQLRADMLQSMCFPTITVNMNILEVNMKIKCGMHLLERLISFH